MERLRENRSSGITGNAVRAIAMLLLVMGIVGRSVLQNRLLGLGVLSMEELLTAMQNSESTMTIATVSLVFQAMEACAAPLFAFLLVEGFQHTSSLKKYVLRVLGVAVLSELPYNLAMSGKLLDLSSRNPVFAMALGLVVLYLYRYYGEKCFRNTMVKLLVFVVALIWPVMLKIDGGICLVFLVSVIWGFRKKPLYRNLAGATATMVCSLVSPFYLAAPMSFLIVHFYNGEPGENNRLVTYLAYPAVLLLVFALGAALI